MSWAHAAAHFMQGEQNILWDSLTFWDHFLRLRKVARIWVMQLALLEIVKATISTINLCLANGFFYPIESSDLLDSSSIVAIVES